jgi:16S rRNA (uracil1498-N3)-methyltransferase
VPDKCHTSAFYVPPEQFDLQGRVVFGTQETTHIGRVLRLTDGDAVEVLDGEGGVFEVRLEGQGRKLTGRVTGSRRERRRVPLISAALAVGRKERFKAAVEKLAELGCYRIWPLAADHIQFRNSLAGQAEKLQAVAVSALKQSRQPFLTRIEQPVALAELLAGADTDNLRPVVCHPAEDGMVAEPGWGAMAESGAEYVLVIGPEGGFSSSELELIARRSDVRLQLGPYWLRSETAAVAGFAVLADRLWGDTRVFKD